MLPAPAQKLTKSALFPICIGHDDWDEQIAGLPVETTGLMHLFGSIGIDLPGNADGTHVDFASNELTCAL